MNKTISTLVSALICTLATTGTAAAANKGVNVGQYCNTNYGSAFKQHLAAEKSLGSWSCRRDDGNGNYTSRRVNMNHACRQQHGIGFDAVVNPAVETPAYGWQCAKRELSINVQQYCKATYGAATQTHLMTPQKKSGDWRCVQNPGVESITRGINMNKACAKQYGKGWRAFNRFNLAGNGNRANGAFQWYCATH